MSLRYRLKRYLDLLTFNKIMKNRGLHLVPCQWRQYQLADKDWFGSIARDRYLTRLLEGKAYVIAASAVEDRHNPPAFVANEVDERVIRNEGGAQRVDHAVKQGRSQRNALRYRRKRRQGDELSDGSILEYHPDCISLVARHHMRLEPRRNSATVRDDAAGMSRTLAVDEDAHQSLYLRGGFDVAAIGYERQMPISRAYRRP